MRRPGALAAAALVTALLTAGCTLGPVRTPTPEPTAAVPSGQPSSAPVATATPSPTPSAVRLAAGSVAQVMVGSLRLRDAPGSESDAVAVLQPGQRVVITDGPQTADGYAWYEVSRGRDAGIGWIAAGDGKDRWLQQVRSGRLAMRYRDGQRVGIGLVDADGKNLLVVEGDPRKIAWSPDGTRLAFSLANGLDAKAAPEVFVTKADASDRHRIGRGSDFAWSPDGSRVAIAEEGRIILHDPESGQDVGRLPLPLNGVAEMTWSPDGSAIALSAASANDGRDVYVVRADTGKLAKLSSGGRNGAPAWSPSGRRLVFSSPQGIVISDPEGSDPRQLSDAGSVTAGAWSPDGLFLLITRYGGLDRFDLRLQGAGTLVKDDQQSTVGGGAWSPDGTQLLFTRTPRAKGETPQTWVANADGSAAHELPGASDLAAWQPLVGG